MNDDETHFIRARKLAKFLKPSDFNRFNFGVDKHGLPVLRYPDMRAIQRLHRVLQRREREHLISSIVAPTVRQMRAEGLTYRACASMTNEAGYRSALGRPWTKSSIRHLVTRETP